MTVGMTELPAAGVCPSACWRASLAMIAFMCLSSVRRAAISRNCSMRVVMSPTPSSRPYVLLEWSGRTVPCDFSFSSSREASVLVLCRRSLWWLVGGIRMRASGRTRA